MRKISLAMASSLDNFIAREDDGVDWLRWSDDVTSPQWRRSGTRLTQSLSGARRISWPFAKSWTSLKGSRRLCSRGHCRRKLTDWSQSCQVTAFPFVRELKSGAGKDICLSGGGDFSRALFEAALIDEVNMNIHPILLGRGVPLFRPMSQQIDLKLVECRPLQEDCVSLRYRVV